jgi:hypothetical protein
MPVRSHALLAQKVDQVGGWQTRCDSDNLVADRVHFLRIYQGLVKRKTAKKYHSQPYKTLHGKNAFTCADW